MKKVSKKILIVDDEADIRAALVAQFEEEGFETTESDNGIGGLLEFERFHPDLALLDMDMSGKNGVELWSKIRELSRIPFVMFTATTDVEEQAARTGGGVLEVIMCASHVKPSHRYQFTTGSHAK